jgi:hypothetical protein
MNCLTPRAAGAHRSPWMTGFLYFPLFLIGRGLGGAFDVIDPHLPQRNKTGRSLKARAQLGRRARLW